MLKLLALGAATVGKAFVALGEAIGAGMAAAVEALSGNVSGAKAIIAELKGSLVQRLDELAEFHDALFDPKPIELPAPAIRPDGSVLDRIGGTGRARDNTAARLALAKAQADAEFKLLKDALERQGRALDQALSDRLLSIRDYYAAKTDLETREIDAEMARLQTQLTTQRRLALSGADEGARLRARAEVAKLESELIVLNNKRADVEVANARKAAEAERELADALTQAREELAQITGQSSAAARQAAIERSYRDLKARLLAENDAEGVSLIDRLIDVKAAQANLAALEAEWRLVTERLRNAQEAIQVQQQAGRSEEHTSELQSRGLISYAGFFLKKKK
ncbi:MAG: hypothetical protein HKUEN07_34300 [Rhodocyclaceae bacterium]|nr:MAG: hypothetical protein HKUEN07_34300 [Rhodocyclaceae bacterium]